MTDEEKIPQPGMVGTLAQILENSEPMTITAHVEVSGPVWDAMVLKHRYRHQWRDRDDVYWLSRLKEEVQELDGVLGGTHDATVEHELKQIASIAMNWLEKRAGEQK